MLLVFLSWYLYLCTCIKVCYFAWFISTLCDSIISIASNYINLSKYDGLLQEHGLDDYGFGHNDALSVPQYQMRNIADWLL